MSFFFATNPRLIDIEPAEILRRLRAAQHRVNWRRPGHRPHGTRLEAHHEYMRMVSDVDAGMAKLRRFVSK